MNSKIGKIFESLTGRSPATYSSLIEIEQAVEVALGHNLPLKPYVANIVEEHGNVFNVTDYAHDLNSDIDRQLSKMQAVCRL